MTANKQDIDNMQQQLGVLDRTVRALQIRVGKLEANGVRGTGVCICLKSPEAAQRTMERMLEWPDQRYRKSNDMFFDHRCPVHGDKAQPAVWGRHKDLGLTVSWAVWESLGVKYDEPTP